MDSQALGGLRTVGTDECCFRRYQGGLAKGGPGVLKSYDQFLFKYIITLHYYNKIKNVSKKLQPTRGARARVLLGTFLVTFLSFALNYYYCNNYIHDIFEHGYPKFRIGPPPGALTGICGEPMGTPWVPRGCPKGPPGPPGGSVGPQGPPGPPGGPMNPQEPPRASKSPSLFDCWSVFGRIFVNVFFCSSQVPASRAPGLQSTRRPLAFHMRRALIAFSLRVAQLTSLHYATLGIYADDCFDISIKLIEDAIDKTFSLCVVIGCTKKEAKSIHKNKMPVAQP